MQQLTEKRKEEEKWVSFLSAFVKKRKVWRR